MLRRCGTENEVERLNILVIDGQGGGLGRQIVAAVRQDWPAVPIMAVGSNSAASNAMLRAGATQAATGENAVVVACRKANIIIGPLGIVLADAMLGEITPKMAEAVGRSDAVRILIPVNFCNTLVAGVPDRPMSQLIQDAMASLRHVLEKRGEAGDVQQ